MSENFDIEKVKGKPISFREGIIFTKIARKVKIRQFKREIVMLISQIRANKNNFTDEEKAELARIKEIENKEERDKAQLVFDNKLIEKAGIDIGLDIGLYLIENIGDAEDEVYQLLSAYTKQDKSTIVDADIGDIIEVFKIMWENGLYKVFNTFMNKGNNSNDEDGDDLKKTK
jgi:hypothetical protein